MIALSAFAFGAASFESPAEARHRGRNLAIGLGAAAATAVIIGSASRAHADDYYYRRRFRMSCGELADRCDAGSGWACDRYERRCE